MNGLALPGEEYLDEVTLRNTRRIYRTTTGFRVVQVDRHREENSRIIPFRIVEFVGEQLEGQDAWVEHARDLLQDAHEELDLPFTYGHKLHYYAQDVLIILVALGHAELRPEGQRFIYAIENR